MTDVLGRSWQMGTIQLDSQMPARFGLTYMGADNREHGRSSSTARCSARSSASSGILIEHYGGEFPFWLAPVQVRVLPVGRGAPRGGRARCASGSRAEGFRADVDERDETLGKRIREAELEKIPFVLVYGDRESDDALAVRERGGEQSTLSLDELLSRFRELTRRLTAATILPLQAGAEQLPHLPGQTRGGSTEPIGDEDLSRCLQRFCRLQGGSSSW